MIMTKGTALYRRVGPSQAMRDLLLGGLLALTLIAPTWVHAASYFAP